MKWIIPFFAAVLGLAVWPGVSGAHQFSMTEVWASFHEDGSYTVDLLFDVDAVVAGAPQGPYPPESIKKMLESLSEKERLIREKELLAQVEEQLSLIFDGMRQTPRVAVVSLTEKDLGWWSELALPDRTVRLSGRVPEGAIRFRFKASKDYGTIALTLRQEGEKDAIVKMLLPGWTSEPYRLKVEERTLSTREVARQYILLGFTHILPKGLDHILFVLGLFLLSVRLKPLLMQVSAFTVAHTLTLALTIYGVVSLPSSIVEPLIAVSISYIAVENIFTSELKKWRTGVVFGFGLVHGMGFAGVLRDLGLPKSEFLTALLTFNLGVELGQLSVILMALLAVGWLRQRKEYRSWVVVPASALIAVVGLYWAVERIFW